MTEERRSAENITDVYGSFTRLIDLTLFSTAVDEIIVGLSGFFFRPVSRESMEDFLSFVVDAIEILVMRNDRLDKENKAMREQLRELRDERSDT